MIIRKIIESTKQADADISGITVIIQDSNKITYLGNNEEVFFGELSDLPDKYLDADVQESYVICDSSDEKRIGANVLVIAL